MKYLKIIIILIIFIIISSCATTNNTGRDKQKTLMLTPNTQMHKNKAYYSKHNMKTRKAGTKRYKQNNR